MSTVGEISKELLAINTQVLREQKLDVRYHFVPLNINILTEVLGDKLKFTTAEIRDSIDQENKQRLERAEKGTKKDLGKLQKEISTQVQYVLDIKHLQQQIMDFVERTYKHKLIIRSTGFYLPDGTFTGPKPPSPAVVYEGAIGRENIVGALFSEFERASKNALFTNFLNTQVAKFLKDDLYSGKTENYNKGFDVGHILGDPILAVTPLGLKLQKVVDTIDAITATTTDSARLQGLTRLKGIAEGYIRGLRNKSGYGKLIEAELSIDTRQGLKSIGANVVFIQERTENQYKYGSRLEGPIGRAIIRMISALGFSKTFEQVTADQVGEIIKYGTVKSKGKRGKKRLSVTGKLPTPNIVVTAGNQVKKVTYSDPKPQRLGGPETNSLISLQQLLDANLVETVKRNMGTGNRRDILNLRSGRLAESVAVDRLSQGRTGMITAFYRYMRYPYATFSSGGKQSQPRSRDPKLLISKSIREVALQLKITQLRAIER